MVTDRPLAGAAIELPAPCAGTMLPEVDLPCARDAEVVCWGPVTDAHGGPVMALVAVCKHHVRPAMRYMRSVTLAPESIEAWGIANFVEYQGLIAREVGDLHVLTKVA